MKDLLTNLFMNESSTTIITRLMTSIPEYKLRELGKPVIVKAEIVDLDAVTSYIKSKWPFEIKDIEINLKSQQLNFKIYGSCWVPKKYQGYIVFEDNYSLIQTEEYDHHKTIKEQYAEDNVLPLKDVPGIELTWC